MCREGGRGGGRSYSSQERSVGAGRVQFMPCEPQRTCHCTDGEQRGSPFPRSTQPVSPAVWLLPPTRSWVLPGGVIPHAVLLTQYMPGSVWGSRQDRPTTPRGGGGEQAEAVSSEPLLAGTGSAPPALDRVPKQTGRRVGARYSFHVRVRGPCHRGLSVLWVDAACAGGVRLYVLSGVVAVCDTMCLYRRPSCTCVRVT